MAKSFTDSQGIPGSDRKATTFNLESWYDIYILGKYMKKGEYAKFNQTPIEEKIIHLNYNK